MATTLLRNLFDPNPVCPFLSLSLSIAWSNGKARPWHHTAPVRSLSVPDKIGMRFTMRRCVSPVSIHPVKLALEWMAECLVWSSRLTLLFYILISTEKSRWMESYFYGRDKNGCDAAMPHCDNMICFSFHFFFAWSSAGHSMDISR